MSLEIEAIYENGVLKPNQQLPLVNGDRVKLTLHNAGGRAKASAGIFRWDGKLQDLERLLSPENRPGDLEE